MLAIGLFFSTHGPVRHSKPKDVEEPAMQRSWGGTETECGVVRHQAGCLGSRVASSDAGDSVLRDLCGCSRTRKCDDEARTCDLRPWLRGYAETEAERLEQSSLSVNNPCSVLVLQKL